MTKQETIAALQEKGVEVPANANKAALDELAKQHGIEAPAETAPETNEPNTITEEEILAKVRAGLTREQAEEVIRNQRAHDKTIRG